VPSGQNSGTSEKCTEPDKSQVASYIRAATSSVPQKIAMTKAIIMQESSFYHCNPDGTYKESRTGCLGLMQLSEIAVRDLSQNGIDVNRNEPSENVMGGTAYFELLQTKYGFGSDEMALAAYNWGPTNMANYAQSYGSSWSALKDRVPSGVKQYVENIIIYRNCYLNDPDWYGAINQDCSHAYVY
jgi:soluble lytic murein transglycosylase-like protein